MTPHRQLKPGFGLLEMILVFALAIGAGAIVFGVYHSAEASAQASEAVEKFKLLVGNLQTVNQEQHTTSDQNVYINAYDMDQAGAALRQQIFKGLTPVDTLNGAAWSYQGEWPGSKIYLTLATPGMVPGLTNENSMWALEYDGVDGDSCERFIMGVAPVVDVLMMNSSISVSGNINSAIVKPMGGKLNNSQVVALCSEFKADGEQYGSQYGTGHVILVGR